MKQPRLAYSAAYWGDAAVVCRTLESSGAPVVAAEFGLFSNWTEANHFATKLNEGLGLSPEEAREITTGAAMVASAITSHPVARYSIWKRAPVLVAAERLQWLCLLAQLDLAITFCDSAHNAQDDARFARLLEKAMHTVNIALDLARDNWRNREEALLVCAKLETLGTRLRKLSHHRRSNLAASHTA